MKLNTKMMLFTTLAIFQFNGCVAKSNVDTIVPLANNEKVKEVIGKNSMVHSLQSAKYFENRTEDNNKSFQPKIEFLETVLSYGALKDPKNILLLTNYYIASNQLEDGIDFYERLLKRYENMIDVPTKANLLSVYAVVRALHANDVALYKRIPWVLNTFDLLEEAKKLTQDKSPIVHWCSGLIYAQMPFFFMKHDDAVSNLEWLVKHPKTEPIPGFYREVYHYLSKLYEDEGKETLAQEYLEKSGYAEYEPKSLFMDWMSSTNKEGLAFSPKHWMKEIVQGSVYAMYGFGFSDIHFIVSKDKKELIAIDAGTQPTATKQAYAFFKKKYPNSPKLTTLIVTHAHWDHVGGHTAFLDINPNLKIIGNAKFHDVLEEATRTPKYKQFRSTSYKDAWLESYQPTHKITEQETVTIGGTTFELIPVIGNETKDALFIHLPQQRVTFVGDVMMPYLGDPWVNEGFIDEPIKAMNLLLSLNSTKILHGHYGLTEMYGNKTNIRVFKNSYEWLVKSVRTYAKAGYSDNDIKRLNLIPAGLEKHPASFTGYLAQRDYVIDRIIHQSKGYWVEDKTGNEPKGFNTLTTLEYGKLLKVYLNLSENEISTALEKMIKNGDLELALHLSTSALREYQNSKAIKELREESADRLRSMSQFIDPMKFTVYGEMIGKEQKMMKQ